MRKDAKVAYYCMEYGIEGLIYHGGLGVLSGDFFKSCADLRLPLVGVGLLYSSGNWHQKLSADSHYWQEKWNDFVKPKVEYHPEKVSLSVQGRTVFLTAGNFNVYSSIPGSDYFVPIELIETKGNNGDRHWDNNITSDLYPGDDYHKLVQQHVLGTGGPRMLDALGYNNIIIDHMNEGDAALLGLERAKKYGSLEEAIRHIIFTTHTAVPAGRPSFNWSLAKDILRDMLPSDEESTKLINDPYLNVMKLALALSSRAFGVSWLHSEVSKVQFKEYPNISKISSIDNGVHTSWASEEFKQLYDREISPMWRLEPRLLEQVNDNVSEEQVLRAHEPARLRLAEFKRNEKNIDGRERAINFGAVYDPRKITIGYARRFATYKQATLVFKELDRLRKLGKDVQLVFAGKSHPADENGKNVIQEVFRYMRDLQGDVGIWFVEDYDLRVARYLVQGVDLWLNTPKIFEEASGTSGMKAALNGIPHFSVVDGWFYPQQPSYGYNLPHGLIEGVTGWGIGIVPSAEDIHFFLDESTKNIARYNEWEEHSKDLITKLEEVIIPLWKSGGDNFTDKKEWAKVMKGSIAHNAAWFSSHRMATQYFDLYRTMGFDI